MRQLVERDSAVRAAIVDDCLQRRILQNRSSTTASAVYRGRFFWLGSIALRVPAAFRALMILRVPMALHVPEVLRLLIALHIPMALCVPITLHAPVEPRVLIVLRRVPIGGRACPTAV